MRRLYREFPREWCPARMMVGARIEQKFLPQEWWVRNDGTRAAGAKNLHRKNDGWKFYWGFPLKISFQKLIREQWALILEGNLPREWSIGNDRSAAKSSFFDTKMIDHSRGNSLYMDRDEFQKDVVICSDDWANLSIPDPGLLLDSRFENTLGNCIPFMYLSFCGVVRKTSQKRTSLQQGASKAAFGLCCWCRAMVAYKPHDVLFLCWFARP